MLGALLWTAFVGLVQHVVIEENGREYYEAAITAGLTQRQLLHRYLLPAIWRRLAPQALGVAALLVGALGAVDFIGLGIKREVSVGYLLYDSLASLSAAPAYFVAAMAANIVVVAMLAAGKNLLTNLTSNGRAP